ncbi:MAG: BRCT domain-containing protein [Terriglobia bacterium]|nr:BRCT domain-containing protein [Terriglobia bacterium]
MRGEVMMPLTVFERMNKERERQYMPQFANARNAAAGTIRVLEPETVARRRLDFYAYFLLVDGRYFPERQSETLRALHVLGFKVNPHQFLARNLDQVLAFVLQYERLREKLPYEIDGVVMKVNSMHTQQKLGFTAKAPRWAIAYKFTARSGTTQIKDILVLVERTGTGTLANYSREAAKKLIEDAGGRVSSAVSRKTDYVLVGDDPGSNLNRARNFGISVIHEKQMEALVTDDSAENLKLGIENTVRNGAAPLRYQSSNFVHVR